VPELTLSVQRELVHRPHVWEKHEHCTKERCMICDGGLALCTVCGGFEGSLLDNCPGEQLTEEQHDWNYKKFLTMTAAEMAKHKQHRRPGSVI